MTKKSFDKIAAGLKDAIAYKKGNQAKGIAHSVAMIDVKKVRKTLGLSQDDFAAVYGFSSDAIKNWEQKRRQPDRAARILLAAIQMHPKIMARVAAEIIS